LEGFERVKRTIQAAVIIGRRGWTEGKRQRVSQLSGKIKICVDSLKLKTAK